MRQDRPRRLRRLAVAALAMAVGLAPHAGSAQGQINLIRDTEIEAILRADADPIFRAAGLVPKNVELHINMDKELNAFVAGGQHMFLNTGMIVRTKNPNELVGVIAHETGHIAGGHLARSGEGSRGALATYALTVGLGILAGVAGADPGATAGLIYSANQFATLQMFTYTRVQESAADQAAATFLEKAGLSGAGLVGFFDNLRYQEVFSEARRFAYFRSHPLSSDRIEALRQRTSAAAHFGDKDSDEAMLEHRIMVAKLKAFSNYPQQTFQDYPETDQSYPARYARAIAHYRALETDKAVSDIDALLAEQPDNPYLWELKGQVLFEAGRPVEAEPAHRRSVELMPSAPLLLVNLGQTLMALPKDRGVDEAITVTRKALDLENDLPLAWRILAEAYDRKGDGGMARLATAELSYSLGNGEQARAFSSRARELLVKDTPQYRRATDIINAVDAGERAGRRG